MKVFIGHPNDRRFTVEAEISDEQWKGIAMGTATPGEYSFNLLPKPEPDLNKITGEVERAIAPLPAYLRIACLQCCLNLELALLKDDSGGTGPT